MLYRFQCICKHPAEPFEDGFFVTKLTAMLFARNLQLTFSIDSISKAGTDCSALEFAEGCGGLQIKHKCDFRRSLVHVLPAWPGAATGDKTYFVLRYGQCGCDSYHTLLGWMVLSFVCVYGVRSLKFDALGLHRSYLFFKEKL